MSDDLADDGDVEVNIEAIMQEIREQLLTQDLGAEQRQTFQGIPLSGRLDPRLYEGLYEAGRAINEMHIQLHVKPSNLPLIGPLVDRLRRALHQVVLFYVHKAVEKQHLANRAFLQVLGNLTEELERERTAPRQ